MAHSACSERLAVDAELAGFRAQGLRPAPRRQLAPVAPAPARPAYVSWPVWTMVAFQAAGIAAVVLL